MVGRCRLSVEARRGPENSLVVGFDQIARRRPSGTLYDADLGYWLQFASVAGVPMSGTWVLAGSRRCKTACEIEARPYWAVSAVRRLVIEPRLVGQPFPRYQRIRRHIADGQTSFKMKLAVLAGYLPCTVSRGSSSPVLSRTAANRTTGCRSPGKMSG